MSSEERARKMVAKACHWVRLHPDKWQKLKDFCGYLMEEGDLIQRGNVYELARRYGMDVRLASEFKRDHNLWSVLTRYMVMERPSLLSAISFRDTPIDQVPLVQFWNDIVGEDEFVASSLAEARAVWDVQRGVR
ncbi:MAG: hypothetical protein U0I78_05545 [Collinsella aerofaciens]|jgi:hypothetical protein|nr:hypothetical protein [Collinsella aerofaciens]